MICKKDSAVANKMLDNCCDPALAKSELGLFLAGITAHPYMDTFSHFGFSGIKSKKNCVQQSSFQYGNHSLTILEYINRKKKQFIDFFHGIVAEVVPLGHGSVNTMPDRPYLRWRFTYLDGRDSGWRDNVENFTEGCMKSHRHFRRFAEVRYEPEYVAKNAIAWSEIEQPVKAILQTEADADTRVSEWLKAIDDGKFGKIKKPVKYVEGAWNNDINLLRKFYASSEYHRTFAMRVVLPKYGFNAL
jgi:hypothetical protein